jgi:acetolactate synthase-1/3 small subunit
VYDAKIKHESEKYWIIEKTGSEQQIYTLLEMLEPFGIVEFVRSGMVALSKNEHGLAEHIPDLKMEEESLFG